MDGPFERVSPWLALLIWTPRAAGVLKDKRAKGNLGVHETLLRFTCWVRSAFPPIFIRFPNFCRHSNLKVLAWLLRVQTVEQNVGLHVACTDKTNVRDCGSKACCQTPKSVFLNYESCLHELLGYLMFEIVDKVRFCLLLSDDSCFSFSFFTVLVLVSQKYSILWQLHADNKHVVFQTFWTATLLTDSKEYWYSKLNMRF